MLKAKRNRAGRTCIEGLEERLLFATFTVTTNADTGAGSLRQAIIDANTAIGQQDTINFTLPGGSLTITPQTDLPALTDLAGVIIDASTQTGYTPGTPVVTLTNTALDVQGANNTIKGFIFQGGTVSTSGTGSNTIVGNHFLGTSATRITSAAADDRIGAAGPDGRNVINGGTTYGIFVEGNAIIENNNIGTNAAGTTAAPNSTGIYANDAVGLTILNNIVSGNTAPGIFFLGGSGITIQGNLIGVNAAGTGALGNGGSGIEFNGGNANVTGNVISANARGINGVASGTVQGNKIGTDINGTADLGNTGFGLSYGDSLPDIIDNVISGNGDDGINAELVNGGGLIQGNRIGTNDTGTAAIANGGDGIFLATVSQTMTIEDNVISSNAATGITLDLGGAAVIQGNRIGTNNAGDADLGNVSHGIVLTNTTVGATVEDNVISGNGGTGIDISGGSSNTIINNRIGTNDAGTTDLGNDGPGIANRATVDMTTVGGTAAGTGNIIAFNDGPGVLITGSGTGNRVNGNSIFSNTGIGIDLGATGRTANDSGDADTGANNLQNFPVITQAISASGSTTVSGYLDSTPNTVFRIELFGNAGAGAVAANAEGQTFLGFADVTTNSSGFATFSKQVTGALPVGRLVTATATSAAGDTSEFSNATQAGITAATIQVRGNNAIITNGDASPGTADFTDFGSSVIGTPITRTFTISNTGQGSLDLTVGGGVTITGPGAAQFEVTDTPNNTVSGGQAATFTVTFTPTAAGAQTATISIGNSDVTNSPFTFSIIGTGTTVALVPEIELTGGGVAIANGDTSPSTADLTDFGNGTIGGTPVSRTFTIANSGQTALSITGVTLSGAGAAQYSITQQPATSVAAGQSTTFVVRFTPQSGGQFNANVSIANSDSNENPYTFAISGIGIAGDGLPPSGSLITPQPSPVFNNATYDFIVRYADDRGFTSSTFDNDDIVVTGPNGFSQTATFVSSTGSSTQFDATYRITAPGGTIESSDNGTYTATMKASSVQDNDGNFVPAGVLGTFELDLEDRISAGQVGLVNGKKSKLTFVEADNTIITVTLTGGTGEIFKTDNGRFDLDLTASAGKVTIVAKGGNGRAEVNSIHVTGGLKSLVAKTADVTGVVSSTGPLSAITLGSTSGATISTPGVINSINIGGVVVNTQIFSGALLGTDARFGGTGSDADTAFSGGEIRKITIGGAVTGSLFAAGFDPVDSTLLNGNGIIVGGTASRIKAINIRGTVDQTTVFTAGAFPKSAKLGGIKVIPTSDARFDATA